MSGWCSAAVVGFILAALTGCAEATDLKNLCEPDVTEYLTPTANPDADEFFEIAKSYDIDVIMEQPEAIRPDLRRGQGDHNRQDARKYYQKAADLGHLKAMNNLASFLLQGFGRTDGTYEEEPDRAFEIYTRLAEHGEARGFQGMAAMLLQGWPEQPQDVRLATNCMTQAAILATPDYLEPAYYLAELDLGIADEVRNAAPPQKPRIDRGLRLLEDLLLKEFMPAYRAFHTYYAYIDEQPLKAEFYGRAAASAGDYTAKVRLDGGYRTGRYGQPDPELAACVDKMTRDDVTQIEILCPRPGGTLTREAAGLPSAPAGPLDIPAYLESFKDQHPDL